MPHRADLALAHSPAACRSIPSTLDDVTFAAADGTTVRWADHLTQTYCDGVCVVHRGRIVHERYLNGMTERTPHLLMSVSKSVCGAALGISIGRGLLSADDLVTDIAPEFAGTSLDGATVQHVIDMTAGTEFIEDYGAYDAAGGIDSTDEPALIDYERHAGLPATGQPHADRHARPLPHVRARATPRRVVQLPVAADQHRRTDGRDRQRSSVPRRGRPAICGRRSAKSTTPTSCSTRWATRSSRAA